MFRFQKNSQLEKIAISERQMIISYKVANTYNARWVKTEFAACNTETF